MDPTLISNPVEHTWVVEISKRLDYQTIINHKEIPSVSIFHLPESITTKKPEAYAPQRLGLGPIHHFRPEPYKMMEQQKLVVARKQLNESKIEGAKLIIVNKVREVVPIVRSCYDMFIQDDDESLAWIFVIDGLFLLNLFQTYNIGMDEKEDYFLELEKKVYVYKQNRHLFHEIKKLKNVPKIVTWEYICNSEDVCESEDACESEDTFGSQDMSGCSYLDYLLRQEQNAVSSKNVREFEKALRVPYKNFHQPKIDTTQRKLVPDIMMVGNQIPLMVLKEINEGLYPSSGSLVSPSRLFHTFCKMHSPLKLCKKSQVLTDGNVQNVLHYMYYSILQMYTPDHTLAYTPAYSAPMQMSSPDPLDMSYGFLIPIKFISKLPTKEIIQVYEKTVSVLETFTQTKIFIPSASKLHDRAGFMFKRLNKHQGIRNIYNKDRDIYLPRVTLNNDTEVILRNLVAYETLTAKHDEFPLTEYMGLMCALIVNVDDVKFLRYHNVIDGEMGDDQVAKFFIGMSSCIQPVKKKEKSDLQKMIDEVNMIYNNKLGMKMYLVLKKLAGWLLVGLKAVGMFVENSWKIVAFMVSIVTMFMLTYQAYCDVYGCDKKAVTLLPYTSI